MAQPPPPQPPYPSAPPPGRPQSNGLALAGMICGIVSIVLSLLIAFIGIALGIVGLILSLIGRGRATRTGVGGGQATAGIITGAVGIVVGIANIALFVALFT